MNWVSVSIIVAGILAISFVIYGLLESFLIPPEDKNSIDTDYHP